MWRQDMEKEKQAQASDGQRLPVPLYQCKTDYFLGQRGHFTFYKPPFFFYINFESRRGDRESTERHRRGGKEGQMKSILRMPETSGFIFGDPEKEIANRQNSYVFDLFYYGMAG